MYVLILVNVLSCMFYKILNEDINVKRIVLVICIEMEWNVYYSVLVIN